MHNRQPLKQILIATRSHWDRSEVRPAVRENFGKMINCRTPALEPKSSRQKQKRNSFTTPANQGHALAVGSGLRCFGSVTSGVRFPTFPIPALALRCPTCCGQSFVRIAISFTTCPHSRQR
jgi:hypothetical protein